jgi:replicative DNA helicase
MKKQIKKEDIALEASLLKALATQDNYNKFINVLDKKRLISITSNLLKDYKSYYELYKKDIDWATFYTEFAHNWHKRDMDEHDLAYYRETVFPLIQNSVVDDSVFIALLEREASNKIEDVVSKGINQAEIHEILKNLEEQKSAYCKNTKDEDVFSLSGVDCSLLDTSNGLTWFLPSLQAGLKSHMPGQFIVVAADSDTGKSAFCISQAVHVFKQLNNNKDKRPILYCTSEDTKEDLACRFLSCLYREKVAGFEAVVEDFDRVRKSYLKNFDDKLFIGVSIRCPNDLYKIKQKIDKYNPSLIIIDMLDKLSNSDNIQDLTHLYQEIRGIANDGFPIIGTSQTGNTTYYDKETNEYKHRKWLSDKDLSGSKSGKQGAAYCLIMIGKDDEMQNIRYVTTTKKKRGQHVSTTCELLQEYSFYRELI